MDLKINNSKDASIKNGKWKDPGASLYDQLLQCYHYEGGIPADGNELDELIKKDGYKTWHHFLKETYLVAPVSKINNSPYGITPYSRSGCKYPHHIIRNGELVVHQIGLKAAYSRAKQMGIFSGEVKEHLERHYKELGLYDQSTMKIDESMEQNFSTIESYIFENTGIDLYSPNTLFEENAFIESNELDKYFQEGIIFNAKLVMRKIIQLIRRLLNGKNNLESIQSLSHPNIMFGPTIPFTIIGTPFIIKSTDRYKESVDNAFLESIKDNGLFSGYNNMKGELADKDFFIKALTSFAKRYNISVVLDVNSITRGYMYVQNKKTFMSIHKNNLQNNSMIMLHDTDSKMVMCATMRMLSSNGTIPVDHLQMLIAHEYGHTLTVPKLSLEDKIKSRVKIVLLSSFKNMGEHGHYIRSYYDVPIEKAANDAVGIISDKDIAYLSGYGTDTSKFSGWDNSVFGKIIKLEIPSRIAMMSHDDGNTLSVGDIEYAIKYSIDTYPKLLPPKESNDIVSYLKSLDPKKVLNPNIDYKGKRFDDITTNMESSLYQESVDNILNIDLFEEKSHGKLKSSFRKGLNIENGHIIKVVFDLDSIQINPDQITDPTKRQKLLHYVKKNGHNNFVGKGTVTAIIDEDSSQRLQSVKMIGIWSDNIFTIPKNIRREYDYNADRLSTYPLDVREKIVHDQKFNIKDSDGIMSISVGKEIDRPAFMATSNVKSLKAFADLIDYGTKMRQRGTPVKEYLKKKDLEYTDSILESEIFEEKSHGNLKYSFRNGINPDNGHIMKIVFNLNPDDISHTGHTFASGASNENHDRDSFKNIRKTGNNNFASKGKVVAIIDTDTNQRLHSCKLIGALSSYINDIEPIVGADHIIWDNIGNHKIFSAFNLNDKFVRSLLVKSKSWNPPSNIIQTFTVGQIEDGVTYKATKFSTSMNRMIDNMNTDARVKNYNGRGVDRTNDDTMRKINAIGRDIKNINNALRRSSITKDEFIKFSDLAKKYIDIRTKAKAEERPQYVISYLSDCKAIQHDIHSYISSLSLNYNKLNESVDIYEEASRQMADIEEFMIDQSENSESANNNIYPLKRSDVTSPYFVKWLFKTDEFRDDAPENFNFDMLINNPNKGIYAYGYYLNNLEGIIKIKKNKTFYSISMLFVNESSEGRGIGQALLKFAINKFGDSVLRLNVFTFNTRAIHIYKKYGFRVVDTVEVKEEPGESSRFVGKKMYIMERDIAHHVRNGIYPLLKDDINKEGLKVENVGSDDLSWVESYLMEDSENAPTVNKGETPPKPTEPAKPAQPENPEKKESMPQKAAKAESSANGVRRKKLYIAFIEWAKSINPKNTFGSIFDKDAFNTIYPFIDHEMRYFYRLANPLLCVLTGDLTFFAAAELKKLNMKNSRLSEMMIFAATKEDVRVFNKKDKKVYRGVEENGMLKLAEVLGETFDTYLQKMINQGDILNGPIEESVEILPPMNQEGRVEL